jgi:predicted dehydrogenase
LAAELDRSVRITALGDLFADQLSSSAAVLAAAVPAAFDCPADRQFSGPDACRLVAESDVDAVILAAPPATRPAHLTTVVAAGRHVYCETPAAVDDRGLAAARAAFQQARDRDLIVVSGLAWRHEPATVAVMDSLHAGGRGTPLSARFVSLVGLPWVAPRRAAWSPAEHDLRNWISSARLSGGGFLEQHIHALDKALWAFGDQVPVSVAAVPARPQQPPLVRYHFADGRWFEAGFGRRAGVPDRIEELVRCPAGSVDLREAGAVDAGGRYRAVMRTFVAALHAGARVDDSAVLCRATAAALCGRRALSPNGEIA